MKVKNTSGFVYIWYDRKHKRYYIGSHWGTKDDGYICSSRWMRNSYKRRPQDFTRRVLMIMEGERGDLLNMEYKWLQLISENELGKKYYNLTNHHPAHWTTDEEKRLSVGQKISKANKGKPAWNKGGHVSEETKQKIRDANKVQFSDPKQIELRRKQTLERWQDDTFRQIQIAKKIGIKQSPEIINRRITALKASGNHKGFIKGRTPWNKGLKMLLKG